MRSALVPSVLPETGRSACGHLPLEFGRQALVRPPRERVGFEVADVRDGCCAFDRLQPFQRHRQPLAVALLPVERSLPALAIDRRPAVGEPQRGRAIAAVSHELQPFRVGHQPVGEAAWVDQHIVLRRLVVPGKADAAVTNRADAARKVDPAHRIGLGLHHAGASAR